MFSKRSKLTALSGRHDMVSLNKIYEDELVKEEGAAGGAGGGAGGAAAGGSGAAAPAGDGGGEVVTASPTGDGDITAPNSGTSADDVLGKCDHHHDGYLGTKCFHVPSRCGKMYRRIPSDGSLRNKKRKKTPYEVGMNIITDAELSRDLIMAMHKVTELQIREYIMNEFGADGNPLTDAIYVEAVAYHPPSELFFIKVIDAGTNKSWYCVADFDPNTLQFSPPKSGEYQFDDIMDGAKAKAEFTKILKMPGNSSINVGSDDMNLWVIWGGRV